MKLKLILTQMVCSQECALGFELIRQQTVTERCGTSVQLTPHPPKHERHCSEQATYEILHLTQSSFHDLWNICSSTFIYLHLACSNKYNSDTACQSFLWRISARCEGKSTDDTKRAQWVEDKTLSLISSRTNTAISRFIRLTVPPELLSRQTNTKNHYFLHYKC